MTSFIERINRSANFAKGKGSQIARTGAGSVDRVAGPSDRIRKRGDERRRL